jgi:hypothetical protein
MERSPVVASEPLDHRFPFAPIYRWGGLIAAAVLLVLGIGWDASRLAVQNGPAMFLGAIVGALSLGMWASSFVWVTERTIAIRRLIASVELETGSIAGFTLKGSILFVRMKDGRTYRIVLLLLSRPDRAALLQLLPRIAPVQMDHDTPSDRKP